FPTNGLNVGRNFSCEDNDAFEPAEECARVGLYLRSEQADFDQIATPNNVDAKLGTISRDAGEPLSGFGFALRYIAQELSFSVRSLTLEVRLDLKDGSSEQRVDTSTHLGNVVLKINEPAVRTETVGEQGVQKRSDFGVTWTRD